MDFQDEAFLPPSWFHTRFLIVNSGGGLNRYMFFYCGWGKQGHASCKILSLQQSLFLCHLNFMEIIRQSQG